MRRDRNMKVVMSGDIVLRLTPPMVASTYRSNRKCERKNNRFDAVVMKGYK